LNSIAAISLLLLCLALVLRLFKARRAWRQSEAPWPLYAKRLRGNPEQELHQRLVAALPRHIVMSRVPLASVLGVKQGFKPATWTKRLRALQYDFVVCTRDSGVLAAIALDDGSRNGAAQLCHDQRIERASAAAGVLLLRWHTKALPDQAQIQAALGEPLTQFFEEVASSANQSWWPPIAGNKRDPSQG
jgi:hypothetical protein